MKKLLTLVLGLLFGGMTYASALPQANFVVSPSTGEINGRMVLDASSSITSLGFYGGVQYRFQVDTTMDWTSFSSNSSYSFTPKRTGTFRAKLQVRDQVSGAVQTTFRDYRVVNELYRSARIKVHTPLVMAGESAMYEVIVSVPRSEDPDNVFTRWDFNSDGNYDTYFTRGRIAHHVFSPLDVGQSSPTAEIKFPNGETRVIRGDLNQPKTPYSQALYLTHNTRVQVVGMNIVPPIMEVQPGKYGFAEQTEFTFDASKSRLPEGGWLEWSFDAEEFVRHKKVIRKTFPSPGQHLVRVRTCFNSRSPQCEETRQHVWVKKNPHDFAVSISIDGTHGKEIARYTRDPVYRVLEGSNVRFIANKSAYGQGVQYRWDFEGDGIWDTPFTGSRSARHIYPRDGEFFPKLEAKSLDSLFAKAKSRLIVQRNTAPRVTFTVPEKIYVGEITRFFAKVYDREQHITGLLLRFDMDGDGLWETKFEMSKSTDWIFDEPGLYTAFMEVKDAGGKVTRVRRTFQVLLPEKPVARASVSRKQGFVGTEFGFDASRSSGRKLRYLWYYNIVGNGTGYTELPNPDHVGPKANISFDAAGKKDILLRIEDPWGRADQVVFPVYIADPIKDILTNTPDPGVKTESSILTRAEMMYLIFQERRALPPYPGLNPYQDVKRHDWFYESAIQAHRDGLITGAHLQPYQLATTTETQKFIQFWMGKSVHIEGDRVTRKALRKAIF